MNDTVKKEVFGYQAEIKQVLDLMVNSLYSNAEIFLRELISNSSDALDRLRYQATEDPQRFSLTADLQIKVDADSNSKTITISDNGIGMNRQEMIDNLGTIANSGTKKFLQSLTGDKTSNLTDQKFIGQFGVGFYSAFIVADKVTVHSRRADQPADSGIEWESDGKGEYSLVTLSKDQVGTTITLQLKANAENFLDPWRLRQIISKYSDHIAFPVIMKKQVSAEEAKETKDKPQIEEETVNKATALWTRNKKDILEEEYREFYKHVSHDFDEPLTHAHNQVEGKTEYTSLLYIPKRAPFDLWQRDAEHGLKLYIQRVFIMDDVKQFLPFYLRFVRGIIDASDLPLNVSREILQRSKAVEIIKSAVTKKTLSMLEGVAKNQPEKYAEFWKEFGKVIKEGVIEDSVNREKINQLLRFSSTHNNSAEQTVSLDEYIDRMLDGQEKIYYVTADSFVAAKNSPYLEKVIDKGIEVLLLHDKIDEWLMSHLTEYKGKQFQSMAKGDLDLGKLEDKEKLAAEKQQHDKQYADLLKRIKEKLADKVKEVRVSNRLTNSPACIVIDEHDMGLQMQRLMKATGQTLPEAKPIFEINPKHPIMVKLNLDLDNQKVNDWIEILFDQAVLAESGQLEDPANFVNKLNNIWAEVLVN